MSETDFACQWRDFLKVHIYNNDQEILKYDGSPEYEIKPMDSKIRIGEEIDEGEKESIMYWPELDELGYGVVFDRYFAGWRPRAKGCYRITRKDKRQICMSYDNYRNAVKNHNLQIIHYPKKKAIRLTGENVAKSKTQPAFDGRGPLIYYDKRKGISTKGKMLKNLSQEDYLSYLKGEYEDVSEEFKKIKELVVMVTSDGYIVCIPEEKICPRIIGVGASRTGKSLATNNLSTQSHQKWGYRVGWLIDPLNQFYNISLPQKYKDFIVRNMLVNHVPRPVPAVQLYLACKKDLDMPNPNISYVLSVPFIDFLENIELFTEGMKSWQMKGTTRYITEAIEDLANIKNSDQFKEVMYNYMPMQETKKGMKLSSGMESMLNKWQQTINTIFKSKFTSNLYNGVDKEMHKLKVKLPDGEVLESNPFIILMEAGLIPVINISRNRKERWVRNYLAYLMQEIVEYQSERRHKSKFMIIADELNEIYELGKRIDSCSLQFEEFMRQGGVNNIGFCGNTQSLSKLNPQMYDQATHIICYYLRHKKDRKMIGDSFGVPNEVYEQIGTLKEQEAMIFSRKGFVVYDRWGRRKATERIYYRGKIFPPPNYHLVPKT